MPSCVLAYSGGLDTSVILGWLQDEGYDVHCVYVDLGQPGEDREAVLKKAYACGAKSARIVDAQEELCRDFAFPVMQWQARYEGVYLLGTSIARPLISKICLQVAREVGADAYAHGATGKGNDQCRFQLAAEALEPGCQNHRPVADREVPNQFPGRTEMIALCEQKNIPVKASVAKPYSSDENCLHISYEAGVLEDPEVTGVDIPELRHDRLAAGGTRASRKKSRSVSTRVFRPHSMAKKSARSTMVLELNKIGGRNGVGRHRHDRKPLRRHEKPRRLRSTGHDAAL